MIFSYIVQGKKGEKYKELMFRETYCLVVTVKEYGL